MADYSELLTELDTHSTRPECHDAAAAIRSLLSQLVQERKAREEVLLFVASVAKDILNPIYDDPQNRAGMSEDCKVIAGKRINLEYLTVDWQTKRAIAAEHALAEKTTAYEACHSELVRANADLAAAREVNEGMREDVKRPKIVCLCGSTRFIRQMACVQWSLERDEGYIVIGMHLLPDDYPGVQPDHMAEHEGFKEHFDELHKRKIDLADEILVFNIGGYIGESTRSEIDYATAHGKPVKYLENDNV